MGLLLLAGGLRSLLTGPLEQVLLPQYNTKLILPKVSDLRLVILDLHVPVLEETSK